MLTSVFDVAGCHDLSVSFTLVELFNSLVKSLSRLNIFTGFVRKSSDNTRTESRNAALQTASDIDMFISPRTQSELT